MLKRFLPQEPDFFKLFSEAAVKFERACEEFCSMLLDIEHMDEYVKRIAALEHEADEITHTTVELLHKTFITPFDRDDIYKLSSRMDDVIDFLHATAERFPLYRIKTVPKEVKLLAEICRKCSKLVSEGVSHLSKMKDSNDMLRVCVEINRLENEADRVLRSAVAKLFDEETDFKNVIKFKEIYELLETVTDRCEDVANIIEGIVLEYG